MSRSQSYSPNLALVHVRQTDSAKFIRIARTLLTIDAGRIRVVSYRRSLPKSWRQFKGHVDPLALSWLQYSENSVGFQSDVLSRFRVDGRVALIDVPDTGFFHWLVQFVPVCFYLALSANISTFAFSESTRQSAYFSESLELFASVVYLPEVLFSRIFESRSWAEQECWVHELPQTEVYPNAWQVGHLSSLREKLAPTLSAARLSDMCRRLEISADFEALLRAGKGRILVHRAASAQRYFSNDIACRQWAIENNILVIDLARLPVADQIVLLARTSMLIGVHGAGLSNMIWMGREYGGRIVELMPDYEVKWHFASMAKSCGLHYQALVVRTMASRDFGRPESVYVDIENLDRVVNSGWRVE